MTTLHLRKSIGLSFLRRSFRFGALALALACCALPPASRALLPPPTPDGGYPNRNTAEGDFALFNLTSGSQNTAIGFGALTSNTTGGSNTAIGFVALFNNTTGGGNTASGVNALVRNVNGSNNTAIGFNALYSNTTGFSNTATGSFALDGNTTGFSNTANGFGALHDNTGGSNNTANGLNALGGNTIGANNTAIGAFALANNTASRNIALGLNAGRNLTTGSDNIDIGNAGVMGESTTIRIGVQGTQTRTFVGGISGSPITGTSVVVNINGRLGTVASSQRFKDDIKPMDKASEAILALKPVTFRYKQDVDPDGVPQFGLVAEEVEKVNPDLVVRDAEGKVYTVRYDAVNAMLLNEFLKEHRKIEELKKDFQATVAQLTTRLDEQAAQIQKVSDHVELSNTASQLVVNSQ